mmetsp:Transcript_22318/g.32946  ORF Transcript_22318/g.32946 Transcript_22318/m.32946 type:complete len:128 (-) Transcript_22318:119-502(-)
MSANDNNITVTLQDDGGCGIKIPGTPLRTNSSDRQLRNFRDKLQNAVRDLTCFPYPFNLPIKVEFAFAYPENSVQPSLMEMTDISRESTIGILYESNDSIVSKSLVREVPTDNVGYTHIKIYIEETP